MDLRLPGWSQRRAVMDARRAIAAERSSHARPWPGHTVAAAGDAIERDMKQLLAAEGISQRNPTRAQGMANTGAKGFAAIMKARAEQMKAKFSQLADEVNGEFDQMEGHLKAGEDAVAQMKSDNAELREVLGLQNDVSKT